MVRYAYPPIEVFSASFVTFRARRRDGDGYFFLHIFGWRPGFRAPRALSVSPRQFRNFARTRNRGIAERAQSNSIYREVSWFRHFNVSVQVQDCVAEPPCIQSWRFLGETRIAAWVGSPASLPEWGGEHSDERY